MADYKGTEIDTRPTEAMAEEAQRGLDWRAEFGRGGTEIGVARARDLANRRELSLDTVRRMASFFARHAVDKQAEGFSPGEKGYPSAGRIAWALWGGDPGESWANERVSRMDTIDNQDRGFEARPYPNEHAARLTDPDQYDEFRREADAGGPGIDFIFGIKAGESELQAIRFDKQRYTVEDARKWLDEHDFSPLLFEPALEETNMDERHIVGVTETENSFVVEFSKAHDETVMPEDESPAEVVADVVEDVVEEMVENTMIPGERKGQPLPHRADEMEPIVESERRVRMAISSEMPVERMGGMEVLVHSADAIDLSFLNSGRAPLLLDHDPTQQIGVIESVSLDESARKLRATVRFGKSERASEVYDDVVYGIRGNVSIGYYVK